MRVDHLIVGQGIAGTNLAWHLLRAGRTVRIIDATGGQTCSRAAAGMINPITGRAFRKTWMIDDLLPAARATYTAMERALDGRFWFEMDMHRIITSAEQEADWRAKCEDERYAPYLDDSMTTRLEPPVRNPDGSFTVGGVCRVDGPALLSALRDRWTRDGVLIRAAFDHSALEITSEGVAYEGIEAGSIVFCEGAGLIDNPWFGHLPLVPNRGEVLHVCVPGLPEGLVLNRNKNLCHMRGDTFWMGATIDRGERERFTTDAGRDQLEGALHDMVGDAYTVVDHQAGVRPTVKHHRPLIGRHPAHPQLVVFNGMGTKGYSLSPWMANHLVRHLLTGEPLLDDVNITRWMD